MRLIIPTTLFLLTLLPSGAEACRPMRHSIEEIVRNSPLIFIGKISAIHVLDDGSDEVQIKVIKILKGFPPNEVKTRYAYLLDPNLNCLAIEAGMPEKKPHASLGEEWLISGEFNVATQIFGHYGHGEIITASNNQPVEQNEKILRDFQFQIDKQKSRKSSHS
jgi:hypothetical protein